MLWTLEASVDDNVVCMTRSVFVDDEYAEFLVINDNALFDLA